MSTAQFLDQLTKANVSPNTLKSRIKAEIVWTQIIRGKFPSAFQISEKDIRSQARSAHRARLTTGFDYTLRPILFIVPRGSPDNVIAGAACARPKRCVAVSRAATKGIAQARRLRDVAVRTPVTRSSADLPPRCAKCSRRPRSAS